MVYEAKQSNLKKMKTKKETKKKEKHKFHDHRFNFVLLPCHTNQVSNKNIKETDLCRVFIYFVFFSVWFVFPIILTANPPLMTLN